MASSRIERTRDALVAIAGKLLGFLGNSIIEHKADVALAQLWQEGYVPVSRTELETWVKALENANDPARAIIVKGSIRHFLHDWNTFHERQPESSIRSSALGKSVYRRGK
jgi:hypothetical protein